MRRKGQGRDIPVSPYLEIFHIIFPVPFLVLFSRWPYRLGKQSCTAAFWKLRDEIFVLNAVKTICLDNDACTNGESKCDAISTVCTNLGGGGGYECSCKTGFKPMNSLACSGKN